MLGHDLELCRVTLTDFFASQVADASAVSTRSPGKMPRKGTGEWVLGWVWGLGKGVSGQGWDVLWLPWRRGAGLPLLICDITLLVSNS